MNSLNTNIAEYQIQLRKGYIQAAYRGIMEFMSELRIYLVSRYPDYIVSSLYFGYMDMTYFAFTPMKLKSNKLKIAVVYLHQKGSFEAWLTGNNRIIQREYIELLESENIGEYKLSQVMPGVDSIVVANIVDLPDFDNIDILIRQIENKLIKFSDDMILLLNNLED